MLRNVLTLRTFLGTDYVMLEEVGDGPGVTRWPFFVSLVRKNSRMRSQANMTLITPEERMSRTADLLQSLETSIRDLRQAAEDLRKQIGTGEDADLAGSAKQFGQLEGLIRTCQKVETSFVEQHHRQAGIAQGGYALDLDRARFEVGCRLARLRTCCGARQISE